MDPPTLLKLASRVLARNLYTHKDSNKFLAPNSVPREALQFFFEMFSPMTNLKREIISLSLKRISKALETRRVTRNFSLRLTFYVSVGGKVYHVFVHIVPPNVLCTFKLAGAAEWMKTGSAVCWVFGQKDVYFL
jgi:hypothetical protein